MARASSGLGKKVQALVDVVESTEGWTVRRTKRQHLWITSPSGETCGGSLSPSDYRGVLNMRAALRRMGLKGV